MIPDVSTSTLASCSFEILDMETSWTLKVSMSPLIPNNSRLIPYKIHDIMYGIFSYIYHKTYKTGQIITTSAEVTPNGGLVRESLPNPLNSGLGIILICPDKTSTIHVDRPFVPWMVCEKAHWIWTFPNDFSRVPGGWASQDVTISVLNKRNVGL